MRKRYETFAEAEADAADLTKSEGALHLPTDAGEWVYPRYGVVAAPIVGAMVSKRFNGDSYPCGTIAKITHNNRRIETTTGVVFWRRRLSGSWVSDNTWSMAGGHHDERNPSF